MSTVIRDSALVNASRLRDKMRYIDESLDELVEQGILHKYEKEITGGARSKIEDALYTLYPCIDFIQQVKKANRRKQHLVETAQRTGFLSEEAALAALYGQPAE